MRTSASQRLRGKSFLAEPQRRGGSPLGIVFRVGLQLTILASFSFVAWAEESIVQSPFLDRRSTPLKNFSPDRDAAEPAGVTEVRIGYFGPDDPAHPDAGDLSRTASFAIEQANQQGGYQGKPFRLIARWSASPWTGGAADVTQMVYTDGVWAILGGIDGPSTHVAEQITTKAWLPLVSASSSDRTSNAAVVPWMFSLLPGDQLQAPLLVEALASRVGSAPFDVIVGDDHDARCFMAELDRSFVKHGLAPRFQFLYRPAEIAAAELVERLLKSPPAAIVVVASPTSSAEILRRLRTDGFAGDVLGGLSCGRRRFLQEAGAAGDGVVFPLLIDPGPRWQEFEDAFHQRFQTRPDFAAGATYDAIQLLVAAVRQAGLNRAHIADALRELSGWEGVAGNVCWDNLGGNMRAVELGTIADGRIRVLRISGPHP